MNTDPEPGVNATISTRAEQVFAEFLSASEEGTNPKFDQLVSDHPDIATELEELQRRWFSVSGLFEQLAGRGTVRDAARLPRSDAGSRADEQIGDFRLIEPLGHGAMGEVWLAEDVPMRRQVALKLVRPELLDESSLALFAREARAGGRLSHPGIVAVHGHGHSGGIAWIAMEAVESGRTLRDRLLELREADTIPKEHYRETAETVVRIADALAAAHAAAVIHRDVKPANVLLAKDGAPRLTDFGLARITDESVLSRSDVIAGTVPYMSPEQVRASRSGIDDRTDQFSLGIVLFELLTLQRPFAGDTLEQIADQILHVEAPDPRSIRSQVPSELSVICLKALEKSADQRYASVAEFADDLRQVPAQRADPRAGAGGAPDDPQVVAASPHGERVDRAHSHRGRRYHRSARQQRPGGCTCSTWSANRGVDQRFYSK
ncbi:MAG: serine/threonine protein kinase [bacterium]|nr:serine/threonine protein kinase [bacterium]